MLSMIHMKPVTTCGGLTKSRVEVGVLGEAVEGGDRGLMGLPGRWVV